MNSETSKHIKLVEQYCRTNGRQLNVIDIGSGGEPVVPWAIQIDLPEDKYIEYSNIRPSAPIQWRGTALDLPFKDRTVPVLHTSHLLEDFEDWGPPLKEWDRVLEVGGVMIIAVPDHERFRAAVKRGQGDNLSHKKEATPNELPRYLHTYETLYDDFVNKEPAEYSWLYVGRKRLPV